MVICRAGKEVSIHYMKKTREEEVYVKKEDGNLNTVRYVAALSVSGRLPSRAMPATRHEDVHKDATSSLVASRKHRRWVHFVMSIA